MTHKMLYFTVLLMMACASKKNIETKPITEESHPKLLFLNYIISKSELGKSVSFVNKLITDGKLKANGNTYLEKGLVGDLKCSQLNADSIEISHVYVKNPLSKTIEYINDSLTFENKHLELDKAALSLKLQLDTRTKFITISEITDSLQPSKPLIKTALD